MVCTIKYQRRLSRKRAKQKKRKRKEKRKERRERRRLGRKKRRVRKIERKKNQPRKGRKNGEIARKIKNCHDGTKWREVKETVVFVKREYVNPRKNLKIKNRDTRTRSIDQSTNIDGQEIPMRRMVRREEGTKMPINMTMKRNTAGKRNTTMIKRRKEKERNQGEINIATIIITITDGKVTNMR